MKYFSIYTFLLALLDICTEVNNVLLTADDSSDVFNFSNILEENKKFEAYVDICPLKILGGSEAAISDIPYQVALRKRYIAGYLWSAFCGGSLITMKYVVTAAHCFIDNDGKLKNFYNVRVVAGTTDTTVSIIAWLEEHWRKIKHFYKHKYYNWTYLEHDFGVIELNTAFIASENIKPIRLHNIQRDKDVEDGLKCVVSGFGLKEDDAASFSLQMVCVPLVSMSVCKSYYGDEYLHPSSICAGSPGKDSCQGDSGGPLVCNGVLVGVVAWGGECGQHPGVYTKISEYTSNTEVAFEKNAFNNQSTDLYTVCRVGRESMSMSVVTLLLTILQGLRLHQSEEITYCVNFSFY